MPTPPQMHNKGNYIVSLGNVCRWLGEQAEALGVDIFPGFCRLGGSLPRAAARSRGIATGDMGVGKDGEQKDTYTPGVELHATANACLPKGCRGSLTKTLFERFGLREGVDPQTLRHRYQRAVAESMRD